MAGNIADVRDKGTLQCQRYEKAQSLESNMLQLPATVNHQPLLLRTVFIHGKCFGTGMCRYHTGNRHCERQKHLVGFFPSSQTRIVLYRHLYFRTFTLSEVRYVYDMCFSPDGRYLAAAVECLQVSLHCLHDKFVYSLNIRTTNPPLLPLGKDPVL